MRRIFNCLFFLISTQQHCHLINPIPTSGGGASIIIVPPHTFGVEFASLKKSRKLDSALYNLRFKLACHMTRLRKTILSDGILTQ